MKHIFFFLLIAALLPIVSCSRSFQTQYFGVEDEAIVAPKEFKETMDVVERAKKEAAADYQYKKIEEAMKKGKLASTTYWECYDEEAKAVLARARQAAQRAEMYHPQPPPPDTARSSATVAPPAAESPDGPEKPDTGFASIPPVMILETVQFPFDAATPKKGETDELDKYAAMMQSASQFEIAGHADNRGDPGYNQRLSERRAQSVIERLKEKGADAAEMIPVGYGEGYPTASNQTEAGRKKNRRVEIRALPPVFETPAPPYYAAMSAGTAIAVVHFNFDSDQLLPAHKAALDHLADMLEKEPSVTLDVTGYTDNTGPAGANREISQQRARIVADYLAGNGVDNTRLSVSGQGEADPFAPNKTSHGRALNRRVELTISE
ncbi:MAG: OmpA family protein [Thermodesulfobacteriota bacterium]